LAPDRDLTRLFLRRFIENDLISPDADRAQVLSQACAAIIVGGLFVTTLLSLGHLNGPYSRPAHTALQVFRIELLYAAWSMTVMALVAVSVWDALSLDSRDAQILGPLPVRRAVILRAKVAALVMFAAAFAAALNLAPGLIHPVFALSRHKPTILQVVTLIAAQLTSTTAAAAFGFFAVLGLRELLHAILRPAWFRRISLIVQGGLVVSLVTTLLLIPAFTLRVAEHWLARGGVQTSLLPPLWFVGLHDVMSGHIWAQVPRPELPARVAVSERAFEALYQSRRPSLHQLGLAGAGSFAVVLLGSAAAYFWNNRRLPDPPSPGTTNGGRASAIFDAIARRLLARRPLVRAGFFFTVRVLARSAQNRLSIAIPLAIAVAVAVVSLPLAGLGTSLDFSSVPIALLAVQLLLVAALVMGFRHSVRVPADLRARWLFHLVRPDNQSAFLAGARRAAIVKLVLPVLMALLPLNMLAFGRDTALLHFAYGLLTAAVLSEAAVLGYRRLPFASSYVPTMDATTYGGVYASIFLVGVYTVAWLEHVALSSTRGTAVLFTVTAATWAVLRGIDLWQRRTRIEVELDELVDPPTLRLGLME
jgi:hypothetical protein